MDFMGVWMLLGLVIVIGLAVYVAGRAGLGSSGRDADRARSELDRRLAAGDIDADEHRRRADALQR